MKDNFIAKHMNKFNKATYYKDVKYYSNLKLKNEDKSDIEEAFKGNQDDKNSENKR